ncbi:OTU domain-containing protein 6B [Boeremia exigua]|uniref:OTU domain-containing protein 6B n=1 Tax=Boeremia exigua TaxID=749465 RepID=UPI001E8CC659|nr:OTU domain-containing protein 6B [Boeremia exigua]KAH6621853.1 OTU domain-containing protein 6B [Boeremia exigua]
MTDLTAPSPTADTPSPLEALQQRHRKEQRDLVSRITQKKKQATKKTRKGVNDECETLERELRERQEGEVRELSGEGDAGDEHEQEDEDAADADEIADIQLSALSLNAPSATPSPTPAPAKKKNRQKERLARRAADQAAAIAAAEEEAANAPNPREQEKSAFEPLLAARGLALHEIRADGHCLYAAVADQLGARGMALVPRGADATQGLPPYKKVRYAAAGWIEAHADEVGGFMEDGVAEHVRKIRETGEWGGHLELLAVARGYGVVVCVLHGDGRVDRIQGEEGEGEGDKKEEIWLGYFRHSHGLGEHYNSLRKKEA